MGESFLEATREEGWLFRVFFENKLSKYSSFLWWVLLFIYLFYSLDIEPSNMKSHH